MLNSLVSWLRWRLTCRCLACDRLLLVHPPAQLHRCLHAPLPIVLTDQGQCWAHDQPPTHAASR
jgi:hypothetical protein